MLLKDTLDSSSASQLSEKSSVCFTISSTSSSLPLIDVVDATWCGFVISFTTSSEERSEMTEYEFAKLPFPVLCTSVSYTHLRAHETREDLV